MAALKVIPKEEFHKYSYSAGIVWLNLQLIMRTTAMGPPPLDSKYKGLFLIKLNPGTLQPY
jgi:hypothetical protein